MAFLVYLSCLLLAKDALGLGFTITPQEKVVLPNEAISILCKSSSPLEYCRISIPGVLNSLTLGPNKPQPSIGSYEGAGLDKGQCGIKINKVVEANNGLVNCSGGVTTSSDEVSATMRLIVARAPIKERLTGNFQKNFKEKDVLSAKCTFRKGRPEPNITWYLDNERLNEGLSRVNIIREENNLITVEQNLTRKLQYTDNGKYVRCVGEHPLLSMNSSSELLQVQFAPKPENKVEIFGLEINKPAMLAVVIKANPKPSVVWKVGTVEIPEGNSDGGRYSVKYIIPKESEVTNTPIPGTWISVLQIQDLVKDDVDKQYQIVVKNNLGEIEYPVYLSTSEEPKLAEGFGADMIALIVIVILLVVVLASILIFARAKGRWCFAGKSGVHVTGESSDTESAEHHRPDSKKPKITFTSVFKKKSDKVAAETQETKDVTVPEGQAEGEEEPEDEAQVTLKPKSDEGVVYAELDLNKKARLAIVKPDNDKTEYAEIIHTKE